MTPATLRTARLVLRPWRDDDLPAFAALNADPDVRRYFPSVLTRAESDANAALLRSFFEGRRFGPWAVEVPGETPFAGFVGIWPTAFETPFTPCIEIGWRLAREHWGKGYATEGAKAALAFGFEEAGLAEIVALVAPGNRASRAVMDRIGLVEDPDGAFDHPRLAEGHPLRRHLLYRLGRERWRAARA